MLTMITQTELEAVANEFLEENFTLGLYVPLEINNRLTSTLGKVTIEINRHTRKVTPVRLSLSGKMIKYATREHVIDVLKHECIHYALVMLNKPYNDNDSYFIDTCNRLKVGLTKTTRLSYLYVCSHCKEEFQLPTSNKRYTHDKCNGASVKYMRPTYLVK